MHAYERLEAAILPDQENFTSAVTDLTGFTPVPTLQDVLEITGPVDTAFSTTFTVNDLEVLPTNVGITVQAIAGEIYDGSNTTTLTSIDNIRGSNFGDVIDGDGRGTLIEGLGGDDTLSGGEGVECAKELRTLWSGGGRA